MLCMDSIKVHDVWLGTRMKRLVMSLFLKIASWFLVCRPTLWVFGISCMTISSCVILIYHLINSNKLFYMTMSELKHW